eukprot:tig00000663_g2981.t1
MTIASAVVAVHGLPLGAPVQAYPPRCGFMITTRRFGLPCCCRGLRGPDKIAVPPLSVIVPRLGIDSLRHLRDAGGDFDPLLAGLVHELLDTRLVADRLPELASRSCSWPDGSSSSSRPIRFTAAVSLFASLWYAKSVLTCFKNSWLHCAKSLLASIILLIIELSGTSCSILRSLRARGPSPRSTE